MSKYTTEVRFICENYAGLNESEGYNKVDDIIANSVEKIFDFDFPIFDESYRLFIEKKILKHYYTREIGLETVGLWKLKLNTKMNEIMPYYNQLYKSELIKFDPLFDVDLTREYDRTNHGENSGENENKSKWDSNRTGSNESKGKSWSMFNDTPQGGLEGIENNTYLTSATKNTDDSSNESKDNSAGNNSGNSSYNGVVDGVEKYVERVKGTNGGASFNKRLKEFRSNMLNIDMMVIDALSDLFFYLW